MIESARLHYDFHKKIYGLVYTKDLQTLMGRIAPLWGIRTRMHGMIGK